MKKTTYSEEEEEAIHKRAKKEEKEIDKKEEKDMDIFDKDKFDDELDIKRETIRVHTARMANDLSSDIVLAYFEKQKDKQYIIDMAWCAKFTVEAMSDSLLTWKEYCKENKLDVMTAQMEKDILNTIQETSGIYMDRIVTVCVLNRNLKLNPLVKDILEKYRDEYTGEGEEDKSGSVKKAVVNIKNKLNKNDEDTDRRV